MKILQRGILVSIIALCGSISTAQTTVCSGDSVVLVLNGYKQGSTLWQESSDLNTWSNASGKSYNDSLVTVATNTLYYRAIVTDGTCSPYYSYEVSIAVRPVPPVANPASAITPITFNANWTLVSGATVYYLDVASDASFTSFVNGFNNLKVNDKISTVTGIACNKTYYYRVRAYDDSCGKTGSNSNTITVTTPSCPVYCTYKSTCNGKIKDARDGKTYNTVQIGTQCWMAQNLNVGTAILGDLPQTPGADNQNADIQKYCNGYQLFGDALGKCATYGGLYLWNEMMAYDTSRIDAPGPRGICPTGWHLPTDNEWKCLEMNIGMSENDADSYCYRGKTEGGKLKDTSNLWMSPNISATNSTGFAALPGGARINIYGQDKDSNGCSATHWNLLGWFSDVAYFGSWWSATKYDAATQIYREVNSAVWGGVDRDNSGIDVLGLSVRCVKDSL